MHHIIYMSQASRKFSARELVTLLIEARGRNEQYHVTGALVYGADQFLQVMEGEAEVVADLYQHIARDSRHQNLLKLADKAIAQRLFADWSMAFDEVAADQFEELLGYVSPKELGAQAAASNAAGKALLDRVKEMVCT
jgi:hypothetical protein